MLHADIATLDAILQAHATVLGRDFTAYRNHAYRVANFCVALAPDRAMQIEKVAIAAAFHDLGIWTAGTFDYLPPSVSLARAYVQHAGRADWVQELEAMIDEHHKLTPYRTNAHWLVEPFRRADLVDVSRGLVRFGLRRRFVADVYSEWPGAGFHRRLLVFVMKRVRTHPTSPLPMVKL
jgi:hypothetical protein